MFRSVVSGAVFSASRASARWVGSRSIALPQKTLQQAVLSGNAAFTAQRSYASGAGPNNENVSSRITDILKSFDKVQDPTKITPTASFGDLGLDSLDTVEVVMAIEEEFSVEIPDADADSIQTVQQAVDYILKQPEAH